MADTHQTSSVAAVVLAAGASTRYGGVKQRELLPAVLAALRETSVGEVVVVEGAHALDAPGARVVHSADWSRGPGT
jgi:CTP:molybdopterin cytidylyltransferase MocA